MAWKSFGRKTTKPKKTLKQLQEEITKLKNARDHVKAYNDLESERQKLRRQVKQEGFKLKHKKALSLINKGQSFASKSYKSATSKKAKKSYKKLFKNIEKALD